MIVEYIRYTIPPQRSQEFEDAYAGAAAVLERSAHCEAYEVTRCTEEPTSYVVRIEWDSIDGHLEGFRKSPDFGAFFAAVRPFFDEIDDMRHYDPTTITARSVL